MTWLFVVLLMSFVPARTATKYTDNVCNSPLGLQDGRIKDSQLTATSYKHHMYVSSLGLSYSTEAKHGRLKNTLAWCGLGPYRNIRPVSYFQVDFGQVVNVTGLATQGFENWNSYYVKTYKLGFSLNGNDWLNYSSPNKVWQGNMDGNTVKKNGFNISIQTRYLRIYPQEYNIYRCLRVEVYGCLGGDVVATATVPTSAKVVATSTVPMTASLVAKVTTVATTKKSPSTPTPDPNSQVCNSPLGLQDGRIKDSQLSATSYKHHMYVSSLGREYSTEAKHGRLKNTLAWCGLGPHKNIRPVSYFQVDFGQVVNVTGLATQGFEDLKSYYVKTYKLGFSLNGNDWFDYSSPNKVWQGNNDGNSISRVVFSKSIQTRYLRIYPQKYNIYICLRVEVYGCRSSGNGHSTPALLPSNQVTSPLTSATRTPAIHGSQQYTKPAKSSSMNSQATSSSMEVNPSQSYTPTMSSQANTDTLATSVVRADIRLILGICIGCSVLLVVAIFLFMLLRCKKKQVAEISHRNFGFDMAMEQQSTGNFVKREFI